MGYYKELDVERMQNEFIDQEAESVALSFIQPVLSKEFSSYPEADSLLDFVRIFNQRKVSATNFPKLAQTLAN